MTFRYDRLDRVVNESSGKSLKIKFLGSTLSDVDDTFLLFQKVSANRIRGLKLKAIPEGIELTGEFAFDDSDRGPAFPKMDRFEFHDRPKQEWVMDFWPSKSITRGAFRAQKTKEEKSQSLRKAELELAAKSSRVRAIEDQRKKWLEVGRFCTEATPDEPEFFLEMTGMGDNSLALPFERMRKPDEKYPYKEFDDSAPQAEYVRVAQHLKEVEKPSLALKTLDLMAKERRIQIEKDPELLFLKANLIFVLEKPELSHLLLEDLIKKFPGHPASLQAQRYFLSTLFYADGLKKDPSKVKDRILWLLKYASDDSERESYEEILGELLFQQKLHEQAIKVFSRLAEKSQQKLRRARAKVRIADSLSQQGMYDQALASYFDARKEDSVAVDALPSFVMNRAEALYKLKQFDKAKSGYEDFQNRFIGHSEGWRALLRISEIESMSSDLAAIKRSQAGWLEILNRYPYSPGATLARLRAIPCGDHAGFTKDSARKFYAAEAADFNGDGVILTRNYPAFRAIYRIRGLLILEDEQVALEASIEERSFLIRGSTIEQKLSRMEGQMLRALLERNLRESRDFEALSIYSKFIDKIDWSRAETPPDVFIELAKAAGFYGLASLGNSLIEKAQRTQKATHETLYDVRDEQLAVVLNKWVLGTGDRSADFVNLLEGLQKQISPSQGLYSMILADIYKKNGEKWKAFDAFQKAMALTQDSFDLGWISYESIVLAAELKKSELIKNLTTSLLTNSKSEPTTRSVSHRLGLRSYAFAEDRKFWVESLVHMLYESEKYGEIFEIYSALPDFNWGDRALYQIAWSAEKTLVGKKSDYLNTIQKLSEGFSQQKGEADSFWKKLFLRSYQESLSNAKEGKI